MNLSDFSDRLLFRINALEHWLEKSKSSHFLLPVRIGGYVLLVGALLASNFAAVILWPFNALVNREPRASAVARDNDNANVRALLHSGVPVTVDTALLDQIIDAKVPVLVDFWAPWCGPCIMMSEPLRTVAGDVAGVCLVAKVNVMKSGELAKKYGVKGLPTLILFKDSEEASRHAGALSQSELLAFLHAHLSS